MLGRGGTTSSPLQKQMALENQRADGDAEEGPEFHGPGNCVLMCDGTPCCTSKKRKHEHLPRRGGCLACGRPAQT